MPTVTLVMAWGPGYPAGKEAPRTEMEFTLDKQGYPDPEAWRNASAPWRARRSWPGEEDWEGDVQYDPDTGWSLRFFPVAAAAPDAPLHDLVQMSGPLRPGEIVTIREPDGASYAWRVVSVR
jgi:hypothetical protein